MSVSHSPQIGGGLPLQHCKTMAGKQHCPLAWLVLGKTVKPQVVVPPIYKNKNDIKLLVKRNLGIGRDGAIVTQDDWVYDVVKKKVFQLDYCHGSQFLRFHEGGRRSLAPVFLTYDDDHVFAYNLILLASRNRIRVGPLARFLKSWILQFRKRRRSTSSECPEEKPFPQWMTPKRQRLS